MGADLDVGAFPNLQKLVLQDQGTYSQDLDTDDACVCSLAAAAPRLQQLRVSYSRNITDRSLTSLPESCPQLRALQIDCCTNVTAVGVAHLDRCPSLQILNVKGIPGVAQAVASLGVESGIVTVEPDVPPENTW